MLTRRSFFVGLGSLVTSAFVSRAKAHVLDTGQPLLIRPRQVEQRLYLYEGFDPDGGEHSYKYRVSLGPDQEMAPAPPTWREHLSGNGHSLATQEEVERVLRQKGLHLSDLDQPLPARSWEPYWDHYASPQARAHQLLRDLQLDWDASARGRKAGDIAFTDWGGHPGSCERWVDVKDDLSVSILQACITERGLPIRIVLATL